MVAQPSSSPVTPQLTTPSTVNEATICTLCGLPAHRNIQETFDGQVAHFCCYACRYIYQTVAPELADGISLPVAIGQAGLDLNAPCCRGIIHGDPAEVAQNTLARLMLNAFLGMMVMVLSLALYSDFFFAAWGEAGQGVRAIFQTLMMVFATPAILMLALPILEDAILTFQVYRQLTTSALIVIGTLTAYGVSVYTVFTGEGHTYFETATMTLLFVTLGRWLDAKTQVESSKALDTLLERTPVTASVIQTDGEISQTPVDRIQVGNQIRVRPGERFAIDGLIVSGQGSIDEATITGEAMAVFKTSGDKIYAGTTNLDGSFIVNTTQVGEDRVMGKLIRLLDEARLHRAPVERLADRVAAYFVPVVITLASLTFLYWTWQVGFSMGLLNGLAVLLIACPCALGIATPLTIWAALGRAAESGILIRESRVLEKLANLQQIFFDKTGTLTTGQPKLTDFIALPGEDKQTVLQWAASLEDHVDHPLAKAITEAAREQQLTYLTVAEFKAVPGLGIVGQLAEQQVTVGSWRFVEQQGLVLPPELTTAQHRLEVAGSTIIFIGWQGLVRGVFGLTETLRPETKMVLAQLSKLNIPVQILTGDGSKAATVLAERLGVTVRSQLLPHHKVELVADTEAEKVTAMVGDGLNDAPALSRASVGIALGCGADVTREAADVSLLGNNLAQVGWTIALARRTYRTIAWNLTWAFIYNVVGIGLAMAGLLHPVLAAAAMVISSAMVLFNALRVMRIQAIS